MSNGRRSTSREDGTAWEPAGITLLRKLVVLSPVIGVVLLFIAAFYLAAAQPSMTPGLDKLFGTERPSEWGQDDVIAALKFIGAAFVAGLVGTLCSMLLSLWRVEHSGRGPYFMAVFCGMALMVGVALVGR